MFMLTVFYCWAVNQVQNQDLRKTEVISPSFLFKIFTPPFSVLSTKQELISQVDA